MKTKRSEVIKSYTVPTVRLIEFESETPILVASLQGDVDNNGLEDFEDGGSITIGERGGEVDLNPIIP